MLNKVQLIGNLGRDAEVRYTQGGSAVASMNLATKETWKDKNGAKQERTEWHRLVLWGKVAESLQQYLVKGKQLYVEGRLQTRQWEKDGHKNYTTEINVSIIKLLGGGNGQQRREPGDDNFGGGGGRDDFGGRDSEPCGETMTDDDIPF